MTQAKTKQPTLTFEEYLTYDDSTDNRYELVDGELVLMPPPVPRRSDIVNFLYICFYLEIQRLRQDWVVRQSDVGIRTGKKKSRLPDVSVIDGEQWRELESSPAVLQAPFLLVVEVVSQGSKTTDYRDKKKEYAARGILEYWIVDFLTAKVSVLLLVEDHYQVAEFVGSEKVISPTFPGLELTASQVLAANQ